jgi:hypothetical protein
MDVHDGFATIQFFEEGLQGEVSKTHTVGICKENNAIEPESVEGIGEFLQGGIDIRQGEAGKVSKAVRPRTNQFGREFVSPARQSPSLGVVPGKHSGRAQRYDGDIDTGVVQERDGSFLGPPKR